MKHLFKMAIGVVAVVALAETAFASRTASTVEPAPRAFMETGNYTSIPIGHYMFCNENPHECRTRTRQDVRMDLTPRRWRELVDINQRVNRTIKPITDQALYGTEEHWTYPTLAGDCEDYVLQKRHELLQRGWSEASLLITVVRQPNGEGHAVLTVRTDRGDLVLDNLEDRVTLWSDTPYHFIKRQSKHHTGKWETIHDERITVASGLQ